MHQDKTQTLSWSHKLLRWAKSDDPQAFAEMIDTQYQQFIFNIIGASIVPILFILLIDGALSEPWVWLWWSYHALLGIYHFFERKRYLAIPKKRRDRHKWYRKALLMMALSGLSWGLTPYAFYQISGQASPLIFSATIALMLSGGLALIYLPVGYIIFSLFSMPLVAISMLVLTDGWSLLATMIFVYITMMVNFSIGANRTVAESIKRRFENIKLIKQLERADKTKQKLLATASHDLRQPLQALNLLTYTSLETGKADKSTLAAMQKSVLNLNDLFNSMLDISRLDSGVIEVCAIDFEICEMLNDLLSDFQDFADSKNLELNFDNAQRHWVKADPVLTRRIMMNLIQNSINYTEQGIVKIHTELKDNYLLVSVIDTGIGIAENKIDEIFSEFYQIDTPQKAKSNKGMGLGLSIVQRLADLQKIQLKVSSKLGKGSQFSIALPLGQEIMHSIDRQESTSSSAITNQTILIVDDDIEILNAMQKQLEHWGYQVLASDNSKQALEFKAFDLVVSDYHLDDEMTGKELISVINENSDRSIPSIIITGDTNTERIKELKSIQSLVLYKPVVPAKLRLALEHLLNQP